MADHVLRNSALNSTLRFDPTLSVRVTGEELFESVRAPLKLTGSGKLSVATPPVKLELWKLESSQGAQFLVVDDVQAGLMFLLRLVGQSEHDGREPDFLSSPAYSITVDDREVAFEHYSDPMIADLVWNQISTPSRILMRVFLRSIDERTEEFLWLWLENDRLMKIFLAVTIDPAQLMRT